MLKLQETWSHCGPLLGQGWRSGRKRTENEAIKGKLEGQGEESRVTKVTKDNQSPSPPPVVYITHAKALISKDMSNPRETYFYLNSAALNHICHTQDYFSSYWKLESPRELKPQTDIAMPLVLATSLSVPT